MFKLLGCVSIVLIGLALAACPTATTTTFQSAELPALPKEPVRTGGTLRLPDGDGPFPVVVILHASGGVTDNEAVAWPQFLNALTYATLTVDTAGHRGGRFRDWTEGDQILDAYGALDFLAAHEKIDVRRAAVMGFSRGANSINSFMTQDVASPGGRQFKAAISMYGRCSRANFSTELKYPVAMIIGDKELPLRLSDCLDHIGKTAVEINILEGAYHAFDNARFTTLRKDRFGNPMLYDPKARKKSEELVKDFLAKHLAG